MSQTNTSPGQIYVLGAVLNNSKDHTNLTRWFRASENQLTHISSLMRKTDKKPKMLLGRKLSDFIIYANPNQTFVQAFTELHGPPSIVNSDDTTYPGMKDIFYIESKFNVSSGNYPGTYTCKCDYFNKDYSTKDKQLFNENFFEDLNWLKNQVKPLIRYYKSDITITNLDIHSRFELGSTIALHLLKHGFEKPLENDNVNSSNDLCDLKLSFVNKNIRIEFLIREAQPNRLHRYGIWLSLEHIEPHSSQSLTRNDIDQRILSMKDRLYEMSRIVEINTSTKPLQDSQAVQVLVDYNSLVNPLIQIMGNIRDRISRYYLSKLRKSVSDKNLRKILPTSIHYITTENLNSLMYLSLRKKSNSSLKKELRSMTKKGLKEVISLLKSNNLKVSRSLLAYSSKINTVADLIVLVDPEWKDLSKKIKALVKKK